MDLSVIAHGDEEAIGFLVGKRDRHDSHEDQ